MRHEITNTIRARTYADREIFDSDHSRITVENGVINLETMQLEPHDPARPSRIKLNAAYDPDAKSPAYDRFIESVLPDGEDRTTIHELFGSALLRRSLNLEKITMMVGEGLNGKSTLLNLMNDVLGKKNVSHVSIHDLINHRFFRSDLDGKLANIYADISDDDLHHMGVIKSLVTGETVTVEKKHTRQFDIDSHAKMFFSCNRLPEIQEDSDAVFRRFVIVEFMASFEGDAQDPHLAERLSTDGEKSGILNILLEAAQRIRKNGRLTHPASIAEMRLEWKERADPVSNFAAACLSDDPGHFEPKSDVYAAYAGFCGRRDLIPKSKQGFTQRMERIGHKSARHRFEGRSIHAWVDTRLKPQDGRPGETAGTADGGPGETAGTEPPAGKPDEPRGASGGDGTEGDGYFACTTCGAGPFSDGAAGNRRAHAARDAPGDGTRMRCGGYAMSRKKTTLLGHFPGHLKPRPRQREIMARIDEALRSGYRDIILCAPTGIGKSAIAAAFAASHNSSYILTAQKILQDQYTGDFEWMVPGKGKENFPCMAMYDYGRTGYGEAAADPSLSCANGVCTWTGPAGTETCEYKPSMEEFDPERGGCCHYYMAKYAALNARHPVYNYAAYFSVRDQHLPPEMTERGCVVCDEVHELEDALVGHIGISITREDMTAAGLRFADFDLAGPDGLGDMMTAMRTAYREESRMMDRRAGRRLLGVQSGLRRLKMIRDELVRMPGNTVSRVDRYGNRHVMRVTVQPLSVARHVRRYMDAPHRLWMSATIHPSTFCSEMGIDRRDCRFIDVAQSPFRAATEAAVFSRVSAVNRLSGPDDYRPIYRHLDGIMTGHSGMKGLILTTSISQCGEISAALSGENRRRLVVLHGRAGRTRDAALREHAAGEGTVLLSPSLWYGVDLRGDLSRFCVIVKCPYPSLADPRTARLAETRGVWYRYKALQKMIQGMGRSIRDEEDWARTYVLDTHAADLVSRLWGFVPQASQDMLRAAR